MITKIVIPLLLLIALPDVWLWVHHRKTKRRATLPLKVITAVSAAICLFTIRFAALDDFSFSSADCLVLWLLLMGVVVVPKAVLVALYAGSLLMKGRRPRALTMTAGGIVALAIAAITVYGLTAGFRQMRVTNLDYCSDDLPPTFDGYKIVLFSDLHLGSYLSHLTAGADDMDHTVRAAVDSIMAQDADLIVFAGDIQNMRHGEIQPFATVLATLHAPDGVLAILGNHDYPEYIGGDDEVKRHNEQLTINSIRALGWDLLIDDNRRLRRDNDSIVIAGMDNVSPKPAFAGKGDLAKTFAGVRGVLTDNRQGPAGDDNGHDDSDDSLQPRSPFVIMLEHDPRTWKQRILPETTAQLTLSGHTHAGQICILGWYPVSLAYKECYGLYTDKASQRSLFVTAGIGGFIPFRCNVPAEIVVVTLHCNDKDDKAL